MVPTEQLVATKEDTDKVVAEDAADNAAMTDETEKISEGADTYETLDDAAGDSLEENIEVGLYAPASDMKIELDEEAVKEILSSSTVDINENIIPDMEVNPLKKTPLIPSVSTSTTTTTKTTSTSTTTKISSTSATTTAASTPPTLASTTTISTTSIPQPQVTSTLQTTTTVRTTTTESTTTKADCEGSSLLGSRILSKFGICDQESTQTKTAAATTPTTTSTTTTEPISNNFFLFNFLKDRFADELA